MTTSLTGGGQRQRGGCLTAFLVLALIANPLAALFYVAMGGAVKRQFHAGDWVVPVLALACVANTVFAVAMWRWRKWGVYGFVASSAAAFATNVSLSINPAQIALGLLGPVILVALVSRSWQHFA